MPFFARLGMGMAWLALAFVGMPAINILFGALGGLIVQTFFGGWVCAGAKQLGLLLDPSHLWQLSAALAYLGAYFRVPAHFNPPKEQKK